MDSHIPIAARPVLLFTLRMSESAPMCSAINANMWRPMERFSITAEEPVSQQSVPEANVNAEDTLIHPIKQNFFPFVIALDTGKKWKL